MRGPAPWLGSEENDVWIGIFVVIAAAVCCFAWAVTSEFGGKRYPLSFRVKRGSTEAYEVAGLAQVTDFLNAQGLLAGSPEWEAALAGNPIEVDGVNVQFIPVGHRVKKPS
jgi:hypothetical protein